MLKRLITCLAAMVLSASIAVLMAGVAFGDEDEPGWRGVPLSESVAKAHENADLLIPGRDYEPNALILTMGKMTVLPDGKLLLDDTRDYIREENRRGFEVEVPSADSGGETLLCLFDVVAQGSWLDGNALVSVRFSSEVDIHVAIDSFAQLPGVNAIQLNNRYYDRDPDAPSLPETPISFIDVDYRHWAVGEIGHVGRYGLMTGWEEYGQNMFGPEYPMTRAQVVTVLWRMVGQGLQFDSLRGPGCGSDYLRQLTVAYSPFAETDETGFVDVPESAWYTQALNWAKACGVVRGVGDGSTFEPDRLVTREEFAVMIWRFMTMDDGSQPEADGYPSPSNWYSDWEDISFGDEAISALHEMSLITGNTSPYFWGFMTGYSDGTFRPKNELTRAEGAKVFARMHTYSIPWPPE